jgi:hypothetical protein
MYMTKNPITNAFAALVYIIIVACAMFYGTNHTGQTEDSILAPIAIISLFTLSAAVMGYLFLSQPLQLYLDDKKKEALDLFLRTVAIFAGLTVIILIVFFSGVRF